jgi:hypothetical protein
MHKRIAIKGILIVQQRFIAGYDIRIQPCNITVSNFKELVDSK